MEEEILIKTSVSLPENVIQKLENRCVGGITPAFLAKKCLLKYLRHITVHTISDRPTCEYNAEESCDGTLFIRFTKNEHHNLKMMRIITGKSISYITYTAIRLYLDGIVRFMRKWFRSEKVKDLFKAYSSPFKSIYRILKFKAINGRGVLGCHLVIPRRYLPDKFRGVKSNAWQKYRR